MEFASPPPCPKSVIVRRNPSRRAKKTAATDVPKSRNLEPVDVSQRNISHFPVEEILQCEVAQNPSSPLPKKEEILQCEVVQNQNPSFSLPKKDVSENLRVFLRVRPLIIDPPLKKRSEGVRGRMKSGMTKPDAKTKREDNEICLIVNGSQSVTLSPPQSMQDSKRLKSEEYDGFSHVFEPESRQVDVYERVMEPLVVDFVGGKSGMLVAMGPTGSGKTHTVFGCPRDPGMVSRALKRIFDCSSCDGTTRQPRFFFMSMLEIRSERGKGERIIDLSADGDDLCLQQCSIKDLPEIMVSNATEAEAFIARGLLKRATAMTNSNSQSSRSQCIITIRGALKAIHGESEVLPNDAVLSIIDLAGAEREKKTGNQGSRLLESNFINKTSMVFGQCLRALLEHQKNPKKPLQKHFQGSLLTKYLRDYLEGKKRMTLILTAKSGSGDYLDTSFLLRQASPLMKIKFTTVEEPSQKRHNNKLVLGEQSKRRKLTNPENIVVDECKGVRDEHSDLEKGVVTLEPVQELEHLDSLISSPKHVKVDVKESVQVEKYCDLPANMKRNEQVMQKFSKALWNVLKQYKEKLEVSEKENHRLERIIEEKDVHYTMLKNDLTDIKSCSSDCIQHSLEVLENENHRLKRIIEEKDAQCTKLENYMKSHSSDCIQHSTEVFENENHRLKRIIEEKDAECTKLENDLADIKSWSSDCIQHSTEVLENENLCLKRIIEEKDAQCKKLENDLVEIKSRSSDCIQHSTEVLENENHRLKKIIEEKDVQRTKLENDLVDIKSCSVDCIQHSTETASSALLWQKKGEGNLDERVAVESESNHPFPSKSLNEEKPKRRLLPASSILLKEINEFNFEVENEKPRENRGGKKLAPQGRKQTQGNISLLKLLKNNIRV